MKKFNLIIALLICYTMVSGQGRIHTPAEIIKIMEESKLGYELKQLEKKIEPVNQASNLVMHDYYRVQSDTGFVIKKFKLHEAASPFFSKAERYFQSRMPDSAQIYYLKAFSIDSNSYSILTYIGQTYEMRNQYDQAIVWYRKAIQKNYVDYMAHWFLADASKHTGNLNEALVEITIAHILNRNNLRLKASLKNIFGITKTTYAEWEFTPQVNISKGQGNKISIEFDKNWIGYGLPKALWLFEPGYAQSMGGIGNPMIEERECLVNLMVALESAKVKLKKFPELEMLKIMMDKNLLDQYILYEILLVKYPLIACQLTENEILGIKDYILTIRNSK